MRLRLLLLSLFLLVILILLAFKWSFRPTEPFPNIWLRLPIKIGNVWVLDIEGDGSDEVVCYDWKGEKGWLLKWQQGHLKPQPLQPFPLAEGVLGARWGGQYAVGKTNQKDIAVAELQPDGQWLVTNLAKDAISYGIGDLDGDGQTNDVVLLLGQIAQKGKLVWFQRQKDGHWQKVRELDLSIPTGLPEPFLFVHRSGVLIPCGQPALAPTAKRVIVTYQVVFLQGEWRLRNKGSMMLGDWDKDGKEDVLWLQWQPQQNRLNLELRSTKWRRTFKQIKQFPYQQLVGQGNTNKLGDGVEHLLLAFYDGKRAHLIDGVFTLSGWQWNKLVTFSVPTLTQDDRFAFHVGDADGDGDNDLVAQLISAKGGTFLPSLPRPMHRFWLLRQDRQVWSVQTIQIQQNEAVQCKLINNRLWFVKEVITSRLVGPKWHYLRPHTVFEVVTQIFTFRPDGNLQIIAQAMGEFQSIDDLNEDGLPEFITHQPFGMDAFEPAQFWFRLSEGEWKGFKVPIPIKFQRLMEGIWSDIINSLKITSYFNHATTVRWEDKKWFLLVWNDGLLQAVTVPH